MNAYIVLSQWELGCYILLILKLNCVVENIMYQLNVD